MALSNILNVLKTASPYLETGGQIAAAVGAGRGAARDQRNATTVTRDQQELDRWKAEQSAGLNAAQLTELATQDRADRHLTSGATRAQQVALGDLLANMRDVELSGLPSYIPKMNFSGGLRPSALGPMTRQSGEALAKAALEAQLSGSDVPNLPDVSRLGTGATGLSDLEDPGKLDSIMNVIGSIGLGAGSYNEVQKRKRADAQMEALLATLNGRGGSSPNLASRQPVPLNVNVPTPGVTAQSGQPSLMEVLAAFKLGAPGAGA